MSTLTRRRFTIALTVGACALLLLLWPSSYLASPRWDVEVVDRSGQPRKGATVRLVYQNYSVEAESHETTLQTDEHGQVSFEPQRRSANLSKRVFYSASAARAGVHASFGRHAYVLVFGDGFDGEAVDGNHYVVDWRGSPASMQSKIVAR